MTFASLPLSIKSLIEVRPMTVLPSPVPATSNVQRREVKRWMAAICLGVSEFSDNFVNFFSAICDTGRNSRIR